MKKESEQNSEDMRTLFKLLQSDGKVHASDIDKMSKKIDKIKEEVIESRLLFKYIEGKPDEKNVNLEEETKIPTITSFPNKRTSLNYDEFCDLYDQAYKATLNDDQMISSVFDMFDYDKNGKVDIVNIKQMLESFGFKINSQDVRS